MSGSSLGPTIYLRRNLAKTAPLVGVIVLAVLLIAGIVSLINSIPLSIKTIYAYSRHYTGVTPRGNPLATPFLKQTLESESPVELDRLMTVRATSIEVKSIVGGWPFVVLGLTPEDTDYYLQRVDGTLTQGRLPRPDQPEVIISDELARNLNLKLNSIIMQPDDRDNYSPKAVRVVGIAESDNWFALAPIGYLRKNHFPPVDALLAFAKTARDQLTLDKWAEGRFKGESAEVFTYGALERQADTMFNILYQILNVVIATLVVVITLMMGMLINIFLSQRVQEFGLLQALGYTKRALVGRVLIETTTFIVTGWILGVIAAYAMLRVVKAILMDPHSFALDPLDKWAYAYSIPVPVAIFLVALGTLAVTFRRFDPVGVVERRLV